MHKSLMKKKYLYQQKNTYSVKNYNSKKEGEETEQNSVSSYSLNQVETYVKNFQVSKKYAIKRLCVIQRKRSFNDNKIKKQISDTRRLINREYLGSQDIKNPSISYQNSAKKMFFRRKQKRQLATFKRSHLNTLLIKFMEMLKNAIPIEWRAYIAAIGGGLILMISFLVILFGAIFGGENGTTYAGAFAMPFDNISSVMITDNYGWRIHPITGEKSFHYGIDFGTNWHCEIKAVAIGEVIYADDNGTYGNTVIIKHNIYGDVLYSFYAHLSKIKVEAGQMVMQGEVIGVEGGEPNVDPNPGESSGHHLHFGIMNKDMIYVDPADYIIFKN